MGSGAGLGGMMELSSEGRRMHASVDHVRIPKDSDACVKTGGERTREREGEREREREREEGSSVC